MQLTLDVAPLFDDHWTGIPIFTKRLVKALSRSQRFELTFCRGHTVVSSKLVERAFDVQSGPLLRDSVERIPIKHRVTIDNDRPLLFPSVKGRRSAAAREASTIHDMSTLVMPELHLDANIDYHLEHLSVELATNDVTFCVSEATRCVLAEAYPSTASKTRVLYQHVDWPNDFELIDKNLPSPVFGAYAVVVGTIEPRKNLGLLIAALREPEVARSNMKFVIVGRKGWKVDAFLAGLQPEHREKLVFSGFVSEFIKYRIIKHAEFLVYPSIYEGFGIPALEAMSLGKPVIAARTSSFPEVIGPAGIYFDPLSPSDFSAAFAEMSDERKRRELAPKALAHNATFNWQRMAEPVIQWVREVQ